MTEASDPLVEILAASVPANLPVSSREALALVALKRALGTAALKALERNLPVVISVVVPGPDWIEPIVGAARAINAKVKTVVPASRPSRSDQTDVARHISGGACVIGVAERLDQLPALLHQLASWNVSVHQPDAKVIRETMNRCLPGRAPKRLRELDFSGMDFDVICACIRSGVNKTEAVRLFENAIPEVRQSTTHQGMTLPQLEDAVEYGAARAWGLQLKADIADYRAGKITWAEVDRGALLYGGFGTGKTTFSKILGNACGLKVINSSVADLFANSSGYLDAVIKAQRRLFAKAAAAAPCLLFLDELSAMPNPAELDSRNRDYWMPVLLDFYMLLDSALSTREGVVVLGAANRLSDISEGLLRPGRMERAIEIGPPDTQGLARILRTQLGTDLACADLMPVAAMAEGATAAEAMDFVRSARRAARRAGRPMNLADLERQIQPPDVRSDNDRYRAAVHEAGHAVVGIALGQRLRVVSIARKGTTGGYTSFEEPTAKFRTRAELEDCVIVLFAGAAAEKAILGGGSTGAGGTEDSDLSRATSLAADMYGAYAMHDGAPIWRAPPSHAASLVARDPDFRSAIEGELTSARARAEKLAREHRQSILSVAEALLAEVRLDGERVIELMRRQITGRATRLRRDPVEE